MQIPFHLVDVFADQPLTGNPLAVVPQADELDDSTMQSIARELGQAETTFFVAPTRTSADWRLRSFTAGGVEVFGAGHNSLGAWWWRPSLVCWPWLKEKPTSPKRSEIAYCR